MYRHIDKRDNNIIKHSFDKLICVHCKKSISDLFNELLEKEHIEALKYCFMYTTEQVPYSTSVAASIVFKNHPWCLTDEEIMIKKLIE